MYQYRYKDIDGARRTICDRNLQELRKKEKEIEKELEPVSGILMALWNSVK